MARMHDSTAKRMGITSHVNDGWHRISSVTDIQTFYSVFFVGLHEGRFASAAVRRGLKPASLKAHPIHEAMKPSGEPTSGNWGSG